MAVLRKEAANIPAWWGGCTSCTQLTHCCESAWFQSLVSNVGQLVPLRRYTEDWPKYNQEMYYAAPPPGTTLEEHMAEQVALPDYTCAAPECENHAASLCSRCHKGEILQRRVCAEGFSQSLQRVQYR
jgi:hypothetical protein